jgi:hypothetical protein
MQRNRHFFGVQLLNTYDTQIPSKLEASLHLLFRFDSVLSWWEIISLSLEEGTFFMLHN